MSTRTQWRGGVRPAPRGPKPTLGGESGTGTDTAADATGTVGGAHGAGGADGAGAGSTGASHGAGATAGPRPTRGPLYVKKPPPTGPVTPEDAWMWEGVPPGRSLIRRFDPGELRYYMDDDGHGPSVRWLPAAWPPDASGDA